MEKGHERAGDEGPAEQTVLAYSLGPTGITDCERLRAVWPLLHHRLMNDPRSC